MPIDRRRIRVMRLPENKRVWALTALMNKGEGEENRERVLKSDEGEKRGLNMDGDAEGYEGEGAGRREIFLF